MPFDLDKATDTISKLADQAIHETIPEARYDATAVLQEELLKHSDNELKLISTEMHKRVSKHLFQLWGSSAVFTDDSPDVGHLPEMKFVESGGGQIKGATLFEYHPSLFVDETKPEETHSGQDVYVHVGQRH